MPSSAADISYKRAAIVRYTEVKKHMDYCTWDNWRINTDQKASEMSFANGNT